MSRRRLLQSVGLQRARWPWRVQQCGRTMGLLRQPRHRKVNLTYALWDTYQQVGYQASIDKFTAAHPHIW